MRILGRALLIAICGMATAVGAPPTLPVEAEVGTCAPDSAHSPVEGPIFNDPTGSTGDGYRIIRTVNKNIIGAAPGSVVRIATLELDLGRTVRLLVHAERCGVQVRVVLPGRVADSPAANRLRAALGDDVTADSYLATCANSCLTDRGRGVMHAKSYLFSETWGQEHVTLHASSNLTGIQAERAYNDAYQLVGNHRVHRAARKYFDTLRWDRSVGHRPSVTLGEHTLFFFPTAEGSFHRHLLANTACESSQGATRIELTASIWSRSGIAKKLVSLFREGCDVEVLFSKDKVTPAVMAVLLEGGVPTRLQSKADGDEFNHSKYLTIAGSHFDEEVQVVYSGSLNVTRLSEHWSDNTMIRIEDPDAYQAYHARFGAVWAASQPLAPGDVERSRDVLVARAEARD